MEPAWRLAERAPELRWLATQLWFHDAVGIGGGEPKCCKSFLALDLAVALAEQNVKSCERNGVNVVSIPQRGGKKDPEREAHEKSAPFKQGQRFRAGIAHFRAVPRSRHEVLPCRGDRAL